MKEMNQEFYTQAIDVAQSEIEQLREERKRIDQRIKRLSETLATLFRLTLADVPGNLIGMGLTDAVRDSLRRAFPRPLPSGAVVAGLEAGGYDLSNYKNKQASVNGTLQRLAESGEVRKTTVMVLGTRVAAYVLPEPPPATKALKEGVVEAETKAEENE